MVQGANTTPPKIAKPVGTGASTVYSGGGNRRGKDSFQHFDLNSLNNPNEPLLNMEFNLGFGLGFAQTYKILGLGEELKINAFSVDMMSWEWDSKSNKTKYTPYKSIESSIQYGAPMAYAGAKRDWFNEKNSFNSQIGLVRYETNQPLKLNLIDISNQFIFKYDFKVNLNFQKGLYYYIKEQVEWNNTAKQTMWHYCR